MTTAAMDLFFRASSKLAAISASGAIPRAVWRPSSAGSQTILNAPRALKFRTRFLPQYPQPRTAIFLFICMDAPESRHSAVVDSFHYAVLIRLRQERMHWQAKDFARSFFGF